jgi:hypothetical protein
VNLIDHIDVLKEWPFKVSYPSGGQLHLLVWWTQWDRGHALAASSEDRIEHMLRQVYLKEGPEVELRDYRVATLVSPPLELRRAYAEGCLVEDVDNFRWFVGSLFRQAQSKDNPVKKEAVRCGEYRSRWPREEGDTFEDKDHSQCLNCFGGWLPKNHTVESLYLLRRHEPRHVDRWASKYKPKETYFVSTAPEADPTLPLYALAQHFGDHSDGLKIDKIEKNEDGKWPYGAHLHLAPTSFFFHGERLEVPKRFITLAKTAKQDYLREEAEKKKAQAEERKRENVDANERLRRLLAP